MTREQARALLPVITAWSDGRDIQWKSENTEWSCKGKWQDTVCPAFESDGVEWRVKPTPREFWVVVTRGSGEISCTLPTKPGPREFDPCLYNIWHCHGEVVS